MPVNSSVKREQTELRCEKLQLCDKGQIRERKPFHHELTGSKRSNTLIRTAQATQKATKTTRKKRKRGLRKMQTCVRV